MKNRLKAYVVKILTLESKVILEKFNPKIITITGNIGKTTTKDFINLVLKDKFKDNIKASEKSQNSEFGVVLTILNAQNAWNNLLAWLKIIVVHFAKTLISKYPKIIVLEIGADHPGDIRHLTTFVKPEVVVLTAFQENPTHAEFFQNIDEHIREKKYLVDAIKNNGKIIYNFDDEIMSNMALNAKAKNPDKNIKLFSFGKSEGANVQILESVNIYDVDSNIAGVKSKFFVKYENLNEIIETDLLGVVGEAQNYSLAAGILTGLIFNMGVEEIKNSLKNFEPTPSRMNLLEGINNSIIIDDSYNASPKAFLNAIETVSRIFTKGKKIFVLGHMAELGENAFSAHMEIAKQVAEVANIVILSGRHNDFYLEGLRQAKFPSEKIFLSLKPLEVFEIIKKNNVLAENDLILFKGSQSARLEKVVIKLVKNSSDVSKICRQDKEWLIR